MRSSEFAVVFEVIHFSFVNRLAILAVDALQFQTRLVVSNFVIPGAHSVGGGNRPT